MSGEPIIIDNLNEDRVKDLATSLSKCVNNTYRFDKAEPAHVHEALNALAITVCAIINGMNRQGARSGMVFFSKAVLDNLRKD